MGIFALDWLLQNGYLLHFAEKMRGCRLTICASYSAGQVVAAGLQQAVQCMLKADAAQLTCFGLWCESGAEEDNRCADDDHSLHDIGHSVADRADS